MLFKKFVIFISFLQFLNATKIDKTPIVEILNGKLFGAIHQTENKHIYYSFEGIPYAEPPINEKRFESPIKYTNEWNDVRDAKSLHESCLRYDSQMTLSNSIVGIEDCLYINVYTPNIFNNNQLYPVVFYIHGGAFLYGSGDELRETFLMKHQNMILVTFNYRLGPLGFLSTGDTEISGNMGLKDQRMALEWVNENIHAFNGDPKQVLLSGFSAGGASVEYQTLLPGIENLANSAIAFSGSVLNNWSLNLDPKSTAIKLGKSLKCTTDTMKDLKNCLKSKTGHEIVSKVNDYFNIWNSSLGIFVPVIESNLVEDAFITEHPNELLKNGKFGKIPYLASHTSEDGALIIAPFVHVYKDITKPENVNYLNELKHLVMNNNEDLDEILNGINAGNYLPLSRLYTKFVFSDDIKKSLNYRRMHSPASLYSYVYDNPTAFNLAHLFSGRTDIDFGTVHGDDVFLMFNFPPRDAVPYRPDEQKISDNFIEMLRTFVTTGVPRFGDDELPQITNDCDGFKYLRITKDELTVEKFSNN